MNKKLICIAAAALMLSACDNNGIDGTTDTTPLTLTESFTAAETEPPIPAPMEAIDIALFDPFYEENQLYKENAPVQEEMLAAAEKLCDAYNILDCVTYGFYEKSKYRNNFADLENPLEKDPLGDYTYCPLNTEVAADEDELFKLMRGAFTEEYLSDDELRAELFENEPQYQPKYKTIDGVLCVLDTYCGMTAIWEFDNINVISYSEDSAEIGVYAPFDPAKMAFIKMKKSTEYGWRIDSFEVTDYCPNEATLMYNGIVLKTETLNKILYGGNAPENAKTLEEDGKRYTETDLDMTIAEMHKFFDEMFEPDDSITSKKKIYVDNVFIERDGVLYRNDEKSRWYTPEMRLNAFTTLISTGGEPGDGGFSCEQEFYDSVNDETITKKISMRIITDPESFNAEKGDYDKYYHIYVSSGLPLLEY